MYKGRGRKREVEGGKEGGREIEGGMGERYRKRERAGEYDVIRVISYGLYDIQIHKLVIY